MSDSALEIPGYTLHGPLGKGGMAEAVACPSGRRDTPGKRVEGQLSRGFESLGHRFYRSSAQFVYDERTNIPMRS